jgi:hypothetical protein
MTRSKILIAFAAVGFLSAPAFADTANFTFGGPKSPSIKMTVQMGDGKTQTCDMVSSAKAIGPKGCNYQILVGGDGNIEKKEDKDSNSGCSITCQ